MTDLTSSTLTNVTFPSAKHGYDMNVVDQFVDDVRDLLDRNEKSIADLEQAVEAAKTPTAVDQSVALLRHAQETADKVIAEAHTASDQALAEAKTLVEELLADATATAEQTVAAAKVKVEELEAQVDTLTKTREQLRGDLVNLANNVLGVAEDIEGTD